MFWIFSASAKTAGVYTAATAAVIVVHTFVAYLNCCWNINFLPAVQVYIAYKSVYVWEFYCNIYESMCCCSQLQFIHFTLSWFCCCCWIFLFCYIFFFTWIFGHIIFSFSILSMILYVRMNVLFFVSLLFVCSCCCCRWCKQCWQINRLLLTHETDAIVFW